MPNSASLSPLVTANTSDAGDLARTGRRRRRSRSPARPSRVEPKPSGRMQARTRTRCPSRPFVGLGTRRRRPAAAVGALDQGERRGGASQPPSSYQPTRVLIVGGVDAGGEDPDEDFPVARLRPPDLAVLERVRAAVAGGDHSEHAAPPVRRLEAGVGRASSAGGSPRPRTSRRPPFTLTRRPARAGDP